MNTSELNNKDRETILQAFRQFRANYGEESDEDCSNRDRLEQKMQSDESDLDETDIHLLQISLNIEMPECRYLLPA